MNAVQEQIIVIDGLLVDEETGEILGVAGRPEFRVTDRASAEWVMERLLNAEAAIEAIDKTAAVIHARAILANAETMQKDHRRKLEWFHARFDTELGEWAKGELEGAKTRTVKTLYGSISLRTIQGRIALKSGEEALAAAMEFAQRVAPQAIRKELLISAIPSDVKEQAVTLCPKAFERIPERESVTVKTGVGAV